MKHEVLQETGDKNLDKEEAPYRGTVDQYPIILDANYESDNKHDYTSSTDTEAESVKNQSSDDSRGPHTPNTYKSSRKQVQFASRAAGPKDASQPLPDQTRSDQPPPRGRTPRPRIQTDLGSDLQGMLTGQRRAPSPYSYSKPDQSTRESTGTSSAAFGTFKHPFSSTMEGSERYFSARPRSRSRPRTGSDEFRNHERGERHGSPRRSTHRPYAIFNPIATESNREEKGIARYADHREAGRIYVKNDPISDSNFRGPTSANRSSHYAQESPNTSSAEESRSKRRSDNVPSSENHFSGDSFHRASVEQARGSRESATPKPRKERPRLDLSGRQYTYHGGPTEDRHTPRPGSYALPDFDGRSYHEPSPLHSHRVMEDPLANAFRSSGLRSRPSPHPSPRASPRGSPSGSPHPSPPRTPQVNRRSKDYFSPKTNVPLLPSEAAYVRALPHGEGLSHTNKFLPSMLAGLGLGRTAPPLTKCSGSSTDLHSKEHSGQSIGGRRSRNTSPVPSERGSRSSREYDAASRGLRDDEIPRSRPSSRAGSTASQTSPLIPRPERHHQRSGSYVPPPRSAQLPHTSSRAFSFTGSDNTLFLRQPSSAGPTQHQFGRPVTPTPHSSLAMPRKSAIKKYSSSDMPPCPRPIAESGHYDWYTAIGIDELDVCPSCMSSLRTSPFRTAFVPSTLKNTRQKVLCDFSRPWVRLAWEQIIKEGHNDLSLLSRLLNDPKGTKPCPGKATDHRAWFRLPDPNTGHNVSNFVACSECVRSLRIIYPSLQNIFTRSGHESEYRTCDLNSQSRRFEGYLKELEATAHECESKGLREPNIGPFADYAARKARLRECTRDDQVVNQPWHFDPALPQFTICEECYEKVVFPVSSQRVARGISRVLRMVPSQGIDTRISCQLYSERMRAKFLESVRTGDFELLKRAAVKRREIEQSCQERHAMLAFQMELGKDRSEDVQANIDEWKKWE